MFKHMFQRDRHEHGHGRRHMRGGHGHGRRHGGGGRMLEQGELRLVLLRLVADKPSHGYELIKSIEERTAGAYSPSPGVIYPTLTLLEEQGLVTAEALEGKRRYAASPEGLALLETNRAQIEAVLARFGGPEGERGSVAPLLRAMGNLKLALRLRLASGPLSEERVRAVAAAIDAAAAEAEKP